MNKNILVTYATKAGSTAEVADFIASVLCEMGYRVDVQPITDNPDPAAYDTVLCGSAIRAGAWLPEAVEYVQSHQQTLAAQPVAFWTVCLTLEDDTPENREKVHAYLDPLRELVRPDAEGFFAGVMDFQKLSFPVRMMMKAMKSPVGDFRKWDEIRAWVQGLQPLVSGSKQGVNA